MQTKTFSKQGILKATTVNLVCRIVASRVGILQFVVLAKRFGVSRD